MAIIQRLDAVNRCVDVPAAIRVDGQLPLVTDHLPDSAHAIDICLCRSANLDLDRVESLFDQFLSASTCAVNFVSSHGEATTNGERSTSASEQLINRLAN